MHFASSSASAAEIAPVKRGRGRPRLDPSQRKPKPQPTGRPRGRPRKNSSQLTLTSKTKTPAPTGRPRGRPRKEHSQHHTPLVSIPRSDCESSDGESDQKIELLLPLSTTGSRTPLSDDISPFTPNPKPTGRPRGRPKGSVNKKRRASSDPEDDDQHAKNGIHPTGAPGNTARRAGAQPVMGGTVMRIFRAYQRPTKGEGDVVFICAEEDTDESDGESSRSFEEELGMGVVII
ncbi:hypothetical protein B0T19DRAFT_275200 [Cercophora scortea]|uniref:Uncharacterized protein n=1 Tax=Cercophora scortea TaxID=314031 RepID=A0AAE0I7B8_9PEZI|nr:hypothetical protein B0T19DRAFT_275200 [Cercophora scortea]